MVSPQLESLVVRGSHHLELYCFTNCKNLSKLVHLGRLVDNKKYVERSTLEKLLRLPTFQILQLDLFFVEILSADTVPNTLPVVLRCVWFISLSIDFGKLDHTSFALALIRGSSNLSKLEIWIRGSSNNAEGALSYLDMAACFDRPLNNLEYVTMHWFKGSKTELLLVRLLFARAPSLVRMSIKPKRAIGAREERDVATTELMRFPEHLPKQNCSCFIFS
ncbi:uncharacterized protein [Nicotiana sylvestris]|uniref:uncharacterized protein n=1 Tax=Nicotiana sylvestris TaxID=4096 RepID=UPI00388CD46F